MTSPAAETASLTTRVEAQMLHLPECPLLTELRSRLAAAESESGISATVSEAEGEYPSPTLLIGDQDVTGADCVPGAYCRLDLPSVSQIVTALVAGAALLTDPDSTAKAQQPTGR